MPQQKRILAGKTGVEMKYKGKEEQSCHGLGEETLYYTFTVGI